MIWNWVDRKGRSIRHKRGDIKAVTGSFAFSLIRTTLWKIEKMSWRHGHRWVYLVTAACMIFLGYGIYVVGRGKVLQCTRRFPGSYYVENTGTRLALMAFAGQSDFDLFSSRWAVDVCRDECTAVDLGAVFNKYTALWMTIVYIICLANEGLQKDRI